MLTCLPMAEIHGAVFLRAIASFPAAPVLDARAYPYFDLHGLWRTGAFRCMAEAGSSYVHAAIDLGPLLDTASRWRRRQAARDTVSASLGHEADGPSILLLNREIEIEVLADLLRGAAIPGGGSWTVQVFADPAKAAGT